MRDFELSVGIVFWIMLFLSPWFFSAMILRMIDRAASLRKQSFRIALIDMFSLVFMIQIPNAIAIRVYDREDGLSWIMLTAGAALMVLLWLVTIDRVSRAGIHSTSARAWISLLVIPVTYVGSFCMNGLVIRLYWGIVFGVDSDSAIWNALTAMALASLMILAYYKTRQIIEIAGQSQPRGTVTAV